jgi:RNA polymerase sigma-70 factor (ECF subfamily)
VESDEELMILYQQGQPSAFEELYSRYKTRLTKFIQIRLTGKQMQYVDDLFQITWLKIHRARHAFQRDKKFSTWLFQIAINSIRDHLSLKRFKDETLTAETDSLKEVEDDPTWRLDLAKMSFAFAELSFVQREALLLSEVEGFTSTEIAEMLGLADANVRQVVSRARAKLRAALKGMNHGRN